MITAIDYCKAAVSGRIDSSNALQFENELMELVPSPCEGFTLDIEKLSYISSAGLRVLMKLRKSCCGPVKIINSNEQVYSVLEMTGFSQLFTVEKAFRKVSVDGCPVIGKGFYGTVYRLDPDTVVKVYSSPDSIPLIRNEQKMAKAAFIKGIPTAISYDIVKVGDSYGSVFEMLKAKSFNDLIIESPDKIDEIVRRWCDLLKIVHRTKMEEGELPSCRNRHIEYLDNIKEFIPEKNISRLKDLLMGIPDSLNAVHGDFQMKNVMLSDDEPMIIDMDTLSCGHPIFDLAALYVTYQSFKEDEPGNTMDFLGIPSPTADYIWKSLMLNYFGPIGDEAIQSLTDKIRIVGCIRFLYILSVSDLKNGPLGSLRIQHTREHIDELLSRVDNLVF
jgi:uncharacterized protein (TIGR02172 family)